MTVTNGLTMKTKQFVHNAESYSAAVTMLSKWEQLPWTARGLKFKFVVEMIAITCFVIVGSIDIK
jgi:hypothetical protein